MGSRSGIYCRPSVTFRELDRLPYVFVLVVSHIASFGCCLVGWSIIPLLQLKAGEWTNVAVGPFCDSTTSGITNMTVTNGGTIVFLMILGLFIVPSIAQEPATKLNPEEYAKLALPGPEHKRLKSLAGEWKIEARMPHTDPPRIRKGAGTVSMILDDRFLVIDGAVGEGSEREAFRHTIGFDRRHGEYNIHVMDTFGTYSVSARGKEKDGLIVMQGEDNDPVMKSMGLKKKFAFTLLVDGEDRFTVGIQFIDTRTANEKPIPYMDYVFTRKE
jgi:hypothetical protein